MNRRVAHRSTAVPPVSTRDCASEDPRSRAAPAEGRLALFLRMHWRTDWPSAGSRSARAGRAEEQYTLWRTGDRVARIELGELDGIPAPAQPGPRAAQTPLELTDGARRQHEARREYTVNVRSRSFTSASPPIDAHRTFTYPAIPAMVSPLSGRTAPRRERKPFTGGVCASAGGLRAPVGRTLANANAPGRGRSAPLAGRL